MFLKGLIELIKSHKTIRFENDDHGVNFDSNEFSGAVAEFERIKQDHGFESADSPDENVPSKDMRETVTFNRFRQGFAEANRSNSFSYEGLRALYDYMIECEDSMGSEFEFDAVEIDGEWTEYASFEDFKADRTGFDWIESLEELRRNQIVVMIDEEAFLFWEQ